MLTLSRTLHQLSLFETDLLLQLDRSDPLLQLALEIPWFEFDEAFSIHYSEGLGAPSKPIRLMVGLLILKQLENLSDEAVVLQWKRNPYYQAFCGMKEFQRRLPCHSTELVHFRKRIGAEGVERIFQMSVGLHGEAALEDTVHIDTTVQEKNIAYPTDSKLAIRIINRLNKIAQAHGVQQRRTFVKEVKSLRLAIRHFRHVTKRAKAKRALKRLRTIAGILIRELRRELPQYCLFECYQQDFLMYERILRQQSKDTNKIYSLHEPQVYCVAKGKDHKQYEYGSKASIASTAQGNLIVGVVSHEQNRHDNHTLPEILRHVEASRGKAVKQAVCDRGYRGKREVNGTSIILPGKALKQDTRYQRDKKRKQCRRRAAIEPIIGHLKSDFRLIRNYLKGAIGDRINLLMAACAWNLRQWLLAILWLFFSWRKTQITPIC
ncbi:IS5 family transposase [Nitrosomonas sp. PY1]|uniref:IS5 family transposase n=1 Tax=Nitrosomonas sp. PY1 TaxID=1803906 RepID=UPI001FC82D96|nr:IS5 family transposase [Nitrosomonas sp. PY1]GKS68340.1 IS5 family transposase [Nitrosomonas sp. PY1]